MLDTQKHKEAYSAKREKNRPEALTTKTTRVEKRTHNSFISSLAFLNFAKRRIQPKPSTKEERKRSIAKPKPHA